MNNYQEVKAEKQLKVKFQILQKSQLLVHDATLQMHENVQAYFYKVLYHSDAVENHPKSWYITGAKIKKTKHLFNKI